MHGGVGRGGGGGGGKLGEHSLRVARGDNWEQPNEGPMLETLDYTIHISSTPTFLYFDLYLYSAYAAHYVY